MKKKFKYREGQLWDGDEEIIHWIEDKLLMYEYAGNFPQVKKDCEIIVEISPIRKE